MLSFRSMKGMDDGFLKGFLSSWASIVAMKLLRTEKLWPIRLLLREQAECSQTSFHYHPFITLAGVSPLVLAHEIWLSTTEHYSKLSYTARYRCKIRCLCFFHSKRLSLFSYLFSSLSYSLDLKHDWGARNRLDSSVVFLGGGGTQKRNVRFLMVLPSKGIWDSGFSSSSLLPHGCELRGLALLHILAMMCLLPYHSMDQIERSQAFPEWNPGWVSQN